MGKIKQFFETSKFKSKDGSVFRNTNPFRFKTMLEFLFHNYSEYLPEYLEFWQRNEANFKLIDNHLKDSQNG